MQFRPILTLLACWAIINLPQSAHAQAATAQTNVNSADSVILEMAQAYRQGNRKLLAADLALVRGHTLEAWAAYWELKARLEDASSQEVQEFLQRYAGTYQEDRLRADWLLLLAQRQDYTTFSAEYARFRMADDAELRCYAALIQHLKTGADVSAEVRPNWIALKDVDRGCTSAVAALYADKQFPAADIWRKARLASENPRPALVRAAIDVVAPNLGNSVTDIYANPAKFLSKAPASAGKLPSELIVLALIRAASNDADATAAMLDKRWASRLQPEERNWAWGIVGKYAAMHLSNDALGYFAHVTSLNDLNDDMLAWKVRALLRATPAPQWDQVLLAINAMSPAARNDATWVYWRAKAIKSQVPPNAGPNHVDTLLANSLLTSIASANGYYEQLAWEELGHLITTPPAPKPLSAAEKALAQSNPGLNRALYAFSLGLRSEAVREWNYTSNLSNPRGLPGGMNERELLAAADLACEHQIWDRCINTSERTRSEVDFAQRYPMPRRDGVQKTAQATGLDPAYVYGLIRQESRFVMDARSGVGASGMMQLMPRTARWTARKIGLSDFKLHQLNDPDTNMLLGTTYLKLLLDDFAGSMPLATAAYNAGPSRSRQWRADASVAGIDGSLWIENIPFNETRDYVKKVLSNTVNYAALISGQAQSLKARIGVVGPLPAGSGNPDLP